MNYKDYSNFLPSFEVRLAPDMWQVKLQLRHHVNSLPLIGWFFDSSEVVWESVVLVRGKSQNNNGNNCTVITDTVTHLYKSDKVVAIAVSTEKNR